MHVVNQVAPLAVAALVDAEAARDEFVPRLERVGPEILRLSTMPLIARLASSFVRGTVVVKFFQSDGGL